MIFSTKLASALLSIAALALSARSAVVARHDLAELSVVFFDDVNYTGAGFSPERLVQGVCTTLPGDWLGRAESTEISPGFVCTFYAFQGCAGPGTTLSGNVAGLPSGLYNNVESFLCTKSI